MTPALYGTTRQPRQSYLVSRPRMMLLAQSHYLDLSPEWMCHQQRPCLFPAGKQQPPTQQSSAQSGHLMREEQGSDRHTDSHFKNPVTYCQGWQCNTSQYFNTNVLKHSGFTAYLYINSYAILKLKDFSSTYQCFCFLDIFHFLTILNIRRALSFCRSSVLMTPQEV